MPGDDLFKRYLEIGASVLGMSRERAESIVKDLVASGEVAKGQAGKAADWLVERGRSGREEITELVRREIRQQVTALGLATRDDIARLEAQIEQVRAATAAAAVPTKAVAGTRTRNAGSATRNAAGTTKAAGISRSGSVGQRPDAAPPAGGADPSKG